MTTIWKLAQEAIEVETWDVDVKVISDEDWRYVTEVRVGPLVYSIVPPMRLYLDQHVHVSAVPAEGDIMLTPCFCEDTAGF